ncbi:MAG TPA: HigA family addiction module antitoxin [Steroidobacteraceae bacterium]|nr:HigA family addiction module antitoxin [Steroidobacteraceae bacterium]
MTTLKAHHPGAILREEFMEPVGITSCKLAKALEVPLPRVNDIVLEKRSISAEMGLLLSAYFGTTDPYWINLQADYDRRQARSRIEKKLKSIKPHPADKHGSLVSAA